MKWIHVLNILQRWKVYISQGETSGLYFHLYEVIFTFLPLYRGCLVHVQADEPTSVVCYLKI